MKDNVRRRAARGVCLYKLILASILLGCTACANIRDVSSNRRPVKNQGPEVVASEPPETAGPGPEHDRLQPLIGDWNVVTRSWHYPDARVQEVKGTLSNFWMLDGRFVGQEYKSRGQRTQYEGLGALGYANSRNAYTSMWLDTTSTSVYTATGSCDESGKVFTLEGVCQDSVARTLVRCRSITRIINTKAYTFELFKEDPDGTMLKTLDSRYTRK